ncbi:AraC family transcriptional regulator [Alkalimarinus coralli]|uniref:AraC family transcriptional regulator n=1 Tax=Alkalimarinus coralli TaxID=2935863 RepID=UPI00202ADD77|nr:AraC family transcriptional regulator [Alkalimarinus coralli]
MKETHYSASTIYMNMMSGYLSRSGFDSLEKIASDANIPIAKRGRVPLLEILRLVDAVAAKTQNPAFGLDIGIQMHPSEYGIISHAFMNCGNLNEVMDLTIRYTHLINDAFILNTERGSGNELTLVLETAHDEPGLIPLIELDFASMLTMTRFLAGSKHQDDVKLLEVSFKHPPQTMPEHYIAHFKCPVKFNQPTNSVSVETAVLKTKVYSSDPYIFRYLLKKIEEIAERLLVNVPLKRRVFDYVVKQLPYGVPSVADVAKAFNMSPSTLKKHLNQESANFTEICDEVRKGVAVKMIAVRKKPLKEISNYLGFSNSSTFNRAFKRWTNMSPSEYRQKKQSSGTGKQAHTRQMEEEV